MKLTHQRIIERHGHYLMKNNICIFDLDGTLYFDGVTDDCTVSSCHELHASGWRLVYASNNTSKTIADYEQKLSFLGFPNTKGNVLTPLIPMTDWLKESNYRKVWILAPRNVQEYIEAIGGVKSDPNADIVIVCFDRTLTYEKLKIACELINSGRPYVVSHTDLCCPTKLGPIPDCGLFQQLIESTTGIQPITQFGKPSAHYLAALKEKFIKNDIPVYFVGDRLATDIQTGLSLGVTPVLISKKDCRTNLADKILVYPDVATFISKEIQT